MQRINKSAAVHNAVRIACDRQDVVGRSMKSAKLRTSLTSLRASFHAMSSGAISMCARTSEAVVSVARIQAQVLCHLVSRITAWLVGPNASWAYAGKAYAHAERGSALRGGFGLTSVERQRLPHWATAPDLD